MESPQTEGSALPSLTDEAGTSGGLETPVHVEAEPRPRGGRSLTLAVVVVALLSVGIALDLAVDVLTAGVVHLTLELAGIGLWVAAVVIVSRSLRSAWGRADELADTLHRTRAETARSQSRANRVLSGLSGAIDAQFVRWGLSPSERDVAMLLLKGLSLKEIAGMRGASEATVRQQAQGVYRKAQVSGRAELSAHFLEDLLMPGDASPSAPGSSARAP